MIIPVQGWDYEKGKRPAVVYLRYPEELSRDPDDVRVRVRASGPEGGSGGQGPGGVSGPIDGGTGGAARGGLDQGASASSGDRTGISGRFLEQPSKTPESPSEKQSQTERQSESGNNIIEFSKC